MIRSQNIHVADYVQRWRASPFADVDDPPWQVTQQIETHIANAIAWRNPGYMLADGIAVHETAVIEPGALIKGPAYIGPGCFVAHGAYLRGGVWLEEACTIGPNAELKTTLMFRGSKLAHLNFVGDSILGEGVNIEAGAMLANYRNELADKRIRIRQGETTIDTGVDKFGALVGDNTRIGANAVVAPGAIIEANSIVPRLGLVDMS
jgi:NDP-sugar pyrophosphorylase family protein